MNKQNSVINYDELIRRLESENIDDKIFITPLIDPELQVGYDSIDLRLGNEFLIFNKTNISGINPVTEKLNDRIGEYQTKIQISMKRPLILHPHQFVLGTSLEYLRLPQDLMAYVTGRSSWARLGLVIATATVIHPGYIGVITLELGNIGETPIALYPSLRIAQLIFHKCKKSELKKPSRP
jgi:dCTP deaminase